MSIRKIIFLLAILFLIHAREGFADTNSKPLGPPSPDQKTADKNKTEDHQADESVIAQQENFPEYMRWPVIYAHDMLYTPQRSLENAEHVPDHVEVLTYDDMLKMPARDLDEAIAFVPGVTVEQSGNIGQPAQATIGGGLARQVRVIFDDITFNTTSEGTTDLAQFPIESVGKVEVVEGPSSSAWGSALSGVINIFTKPVGTSIVPHGEATYGWGTFRTQRRYFDVAQKVGPVAYFLGGDLIESGDFRPNSDVLEKRIYTKEEIQITEGLKLKGSYGYFGQRESEFNDLVNLSSQKRKVNTQLGRFGFEMIPTDWLTIDAAAKFHSRHFNLDSNDLTPATMGSLLDNSNGVSNLPQGSLKTDLKISGRQSATLGIDVQKEIIIARRITPGNSQFNVRDAAYSEAYYGNYRLELRYLDILFGSRYDNNNAFGHQYSPSAGSVIHLPFVKSRVKVNYQRAFNAPPFANRFVTNPLFRLVPNPNIRAERSTAYSFALATNPFSWISTEVTFFQNFVTDSIVVRNAVGVPGRNRTFVNIGRERRDGVDGQLNFKPWGFLDFLYAINFVKVRDMTVHSKVLRDRPVLSQDLGATINLPMDIHYSLRGKWIETNRDTANAIPEDRQFVFNSKIFWRCPRVYYGNLSMYFQITNMFNSGLSFDKNFNHNPGRQYEFGLRYEF